MDDLLKNAIADAKAVRETALVNAKLALEEAFTPKIQSMLSKKIQSETEGETEEGEEVPAEEEEEVPAEEGEEVPAEEEGEEEVPAEEPAVDGGEEDGEKDIDVAVDDEGGEEVPAEEEDDMEAEEGEYDEDLDLEAIIRELEGEETEEEEVPAEEEEEPVEESNDGSSEIGNGDNKQPSNKASDDNTDDPQGTGLKTDSMGETYEVDGEVFKEEEEAEEGDDEVEENIDLEEILKSLSEDEEAEEDEEEVAEVTKLKSDLGEHRKVIKFLRSKLNEVNLLNAKLLFTNKLFKAFNLNNDEKLKVVETFDRANNLREAKLVYSTLAESFGYGSTIARNKVAKPISEGASKPVGSTKPKSKEIISENNGLSARFKKLANIKG